MSYGGSCFRSTLNRFLSADTIVPDPVNPQQFNRYTYSLNNPVNYLDPTGHATCHSLDGTCYAEEAPAIQQSAEISTKNSSGTNGSGNTSSEKSWALVTWGLFSQGGIANAKFINWLDGGQSTILGTGEPFGDAVKGVGRASNILSTISFGLVWGEWKSNYTDVQEAYNNGYLSEENYEFHRTAVNASSVFNMTMAGIGAITPGAGIAIGGAQATSTGLGNWNGEYFSDSGQAAGQLWAILTVGEITLSDGTKTTGATMLWNTLTVSED